MFFPLAFLLSWYPWLISLIRKSGDGGPNPLGVFVAAIIVTAITEGRTGLKEFFSRLIRWRVRIQWYVLIFVLPFVLCAISAWLVVFAAGAVPDFNKLPAATDLVERFIFIFLFIGLGEEPGWRGFALENLQKKLSPVKASMILGGIWAFWHLPLMGTEFTLPVIPAFIISVFAATFILTWIYNNTRGSVLLPMLFHAAVNTIGAGYIFLLFSGADVIKFWYVYSTLWAVTAAIPFAMRQRARLSLRVVQE